MVFRPPEQIYSYSSFINTIFLFFFSLTQIFYKYVGINCGFLLRTRDRRNMWRVSILAVSYIMFFIGGMVGALFFKGNWQVHALLAPVMLLGPVLRSHPNLRHRYFALTQSQILRSHSITWAPCSPNHGYSMSNSRYSIVKQYPRIFVPALSSVLYSRPFPFLRPLFVLTPSTIIILRHLLSRSCRSSFSEL